MFRLDEFLRVSRPVELPDGTSVVVRVLSDLEMNARRDYALGEALRVTEQLKNPESELYKTKLLPLNDAALDTLLDLMSQARMVELEREARELFKVDFVPTPESPTLEEELGTLKKQSDLELRVYQDRTRYVLDGLNAYRAKVAELPRETMMKELQARAIQAYTWSASRDAEFYYTIWCAVENRDGQKHWRTIDDVRALPTKILNKIYKIYEGLDSIDPWELTKSEPEGASDRVGQNA